jgi:hypothetical protein
VYWDVFKTAKLEDLRPRAPVADDPAPSAAAATNGAGGGAARPGAAAIGKAARVQHCSHSASKMPAGFMSLNNKENRMLAYLKDYVHVFHELYPHRWGGGAAACWFDQGAYLFWLAAWCAGGMHSFLLDFHPCACRLFQPSLLAGAPST